MNRMAMAKSMQQHGIVFSEEKKSTVLFELLSDPTYLWDETADDRSKRLFSEFKNLVFLGANIQATKDDKTLLSVSLKTHQRKWFDYLVTETPIRLSPEDKKHILGYANELHHPNESEAQALFTHLISMGADLHPHKFSLLKTCVEKGYQSLFTYILKLAPIQPNETQEVIDLLSYQWGDDKTISRLPFAKIAMLNGLNIQTSLRGKPFLLYLLDGEIEGAVFDYFCTLAKEKMPSLDARASVDLQHNDAKFMQDIQQLITSATNNNVVMLNNNWKAFYYEINTLTADGETLYSLTCAKIAEQLTQDTLGSTLLVKLLSMIHRRGGTFPTQSVAAIETLQSAQTCSI